ncbi:MAG: LTA synthase family protein [Bacteroidaceae bacterium]|nr:LTA synthase family protein [Bacteroidaceae bacterium]
MSKENTQEANVTAPLPRREGLGESPLGKSPSWTIVGWFVLLMVVFAIGRLVFVGYNHDVEPVTGGQVLNILDHGLLLDMRTAACLLLFPGLCVCLMGQRRCWVLVPYFCLTGFLVGSILMADIVMYEFWEFKLCAVHLAYAASPEGTTNSVSTWFLVSRVLGIVAFMLLVAVPAIRLIPKRQTETDKDAHPSWGEKAKGAWGLIVLVLMALCPVGVGSCYQRGPLFLSHATTNPVYRFAVSFGDDERYAAELEESSACCGAIATSPTEGEASHTAALPCYATGNEVTDSLLTSPRPCILFVQLESFGGKFVKELGGIPEVSPRLSSLIPEGIFWDQYYSNSFRTDRGTVCAYSGWISYPTVSPMKRASMHPHLSSLALTLHNNGYQTGYMCAGPMTNMGKELYLWDMGFETLMNEKYFTQEELNSSWGADDRTSAMKLHHTIKEIRPDAQWMMVWQTLSSHEPWDVPYHRLEDKRLNAFAYTDECLGEFIDSLKTLPVWDNLLVIVIPDHGFLYEQTYDDSEFFHSPMLWLGGAIREPRRISTLMNQSDIAATLLAQIGLPHDEFPWSRNIMAPDYKPFVYCNYPAGLFYKDATGETLYDLTAECPIPVGEPVDSTRLCKALTILHASYSQMPHP